MRPVPLATGDSHCIALLFLGRALLSLQGEFPGTGRSRVWSILVTETTKSPRPQLEAETTLKFRPAGGPGAGGAAQEASLLRFKHRERIHGSQGGAVVELLPGTSAAVRWVLLGVRVGGRS
jgi:hypothetical protein